MRKRCLLLLSIGIAVMAQAADAAVTLPAIVSDGMVLQRDQPIVLWGWADPGEKVTVSLSGDMATATTGDGGDWQITLPARSAGGPHIIGITGTGPELRISDVMIGEVWLGSGQSNMQWIVSGSDNPDAEIAAANFPNLRMFTVSRAASPDPLQDVTGNWLPATPENAGQFSAVGYYFSRHLLQDLNVPIGFIHSSWGGSPVEAWMREETLMQTPVAAISEWQQTTIKSASRDRATFDSRVATFKAQRKIDLQRLPGIWDALVRFPDLDAHIVLNFRNEDDVLKVALNLNTNVQTPVTRSGTTISWSSTGKGQSMTFEGQLDGDVLVGSASSADGPRHPMYAVRRPADGSAPLLAGIAPRNRTSQLYNGMIAPLVRYPIRGVTWYQGEANTNPDTAPLYFELFSSMIEDWRRQWQRQLPFYFVQLANFQSREQTPPLNSLWAQVRDAQRRTLVLPGTAMAVAIDIGEAGDIHPKNKQEVGRRLALAALAQQYNRDIVYSGPLYTDASFNGREVRIRFDHADGLTTSDGEAVTGFAIASADQHFVWANARIDGDSVLVWHDEVTAPQSVRYGWGVNPAVNLVNGAKLPASPFRTDHW
jgi:sialate O-acetylesterase